MPMHKCAHVGVGMVSWGGMQANFVTFKKGLLFIVHFPQKKSRKEFVCLVEKYNDSFLITLSKVDIDEDK